MFVNFRACWFLVIALMASRLLGNVDDWEQLLTDISTARVQGDFATAIDLSEQALKLASEEFGKADKFYFMSLSQLGSSYQMSGELEQAQVLFARALNEKEKLFGPDHPTVAASLIQLGQTMLRKGDRQGAEALFNRANTISLSHPESNRMIESLAFSFRDRDRIEALEQRYLFELRGFEMELGLDHPELLHPLDNLGLLYQYQGRYPEAIEMFQRVLRIREREAEPMAIVMQRCVGQLVQCYRAEARFEDADALIEKYSRYLNVSTGS